MDIALGVSMTPVTVRMVLVEGEQADGATVDHDVFDITSTEGAANSSASEQVIAAILGTREGAAAGGHRLVATGVSWSDHDEAAQLRDALAARRIDDVMLISQLHAAGALAQAAGRAVGYDKTAMLFVDGDTATASVVDSADGSIFKVDSRSLHSDDAMDVLAEMVTSVESADPDGVFLLGSGLDIAAVKDHLEHHVAIPISAPEDPDMALARGAALASASAPQFDALTVGLAYSQDPDGTTAGQAYPADDVSTEGTEAVALEPVGARAERKPFMLVGSSLTAIFVVGVVALVISLAVSIRPSVDTRPNPAQGVAAPPQAAQNLPQAAQNLPPVAQNLPPVAPPPAAAPAPAPAPPAAAETIAPPVPVVQQQPLPRKVVAAEAPAAVAPPPAAVAPAPAAPPPAPVPDAPPPAPAYVPPQAPAYPPGYYGPQSPSYYGPQSPAYYPSQPAAPVIGLPPFIGFGPGPSRGSDPRWYPPQQQWGPGDDGRGRGHGDWDRGGRSPLWPWPTS